MRITLAWIMRVEQEAMTGKADSMTFLERSRGGSVQPLIPPDFPRTRLNPFDGEREG